jgi:predicted RNase H-like HicB family nuclease
MLTQYIQAAMRKAKYEILPDDGTYYGEIPDCNGVWANAESLEACREELQEVLEEWLLLGISLNHRLPVIDGIELQYAKNVKETA